MNGTAPETRPRPPAFEPAGPISEPAPEPTLEPTRDELTDLHDLHDLTLRELADRDETARIVARVTREDECEPGPVRVAEFNSFI